MHKRTDLVNLVVPIQRQQELSQHHQPLMLMLMLSTCLLGFLILKQSMEHTYLYCYIVVYFVASWYVVCFSAIFIFAEKNILAYRRSLITKEQFNLVSRIDKRQCVVT
mmetsp:Transcript_56176/g.60817  ORF Transcript_56176/g.60817 Transcript_56176/m.60817 type:complete len:108 (-) Transcript_56176:118-441(-)